MTAEHRERGIAWAAVEEELQSREIIATGRGLEPVLQQDVVAAADDGGADARIEPAAKLGDAGGIGPWQQ